MSNRNDIIDGADASNSRKGLVYTCRCGWIDLGHARPDGARGLWNQIQAEAGLQSDDGKGFKVSYRQSMSSGSFSAGFGRDFWVKRKLLKPQKEAVALAIFKAISIGFETLQDSWAFSWKTDSGFSAEDLTSNLIGFYRAVRPGPDYVSLCEPVSKAAALAVWDSSGAVGANKNYSFKPLVFPCKSCPGGPQSGSLSLPLPDFLNKISPAKTGGLFRTWTILDQISLPRQTNAPLRGRY